MRLLIASGLLCALVLPASASEMKLSELQIAGVATDEDPTPNAMMDSVGPSDTDAKNFGESGFGDFGFEDSLTLDKDQSRIAAEPRTKVVVHRPMSEVCDAVEQAAKSNNLPVAFFIRLLHQESGFKPGVVSSAGAQGVAQFMPEVAASMGVENPFDPLEAIPASARLLKTLLAQFGNIGLAAAAYNAGPRRIQTWLTKKSTLPKETQGYVRIITGKPVENWKSVTRMVPDPRPAARAPCKLPEGEHMLVAEHVDPPKTKLARVAHNVAHVLAKIPELKTKIASKERPTLTIIKHGAARTLLASHVTKRVDVKPVEVAKHAGKSRGLKVAAR